MTEPETIYSALGNSLNPSKSRKQENDGVRNRYGGQRTKDISIITKSEPNYSLWIILPAGAKDSGLRSG
jgi:hypothetical protein